ncbi:MAG: hypothetical protein IJS01_15425, partial [Lentisphaeria bacterium]|nr:hypothetical protein [Lentisphaeria bacterium]
FVQLRLRAWNSDPSEPNVRKYRTLPAKKRKKQVQALDFYITETKEGQYISTAQPIARSKPKKGNRHAEKPPSPHV